MIALRQIAAHPDEAPNKDRVGAAAFVLSLRGRGVHDIAVLRALETVPRELFAPRRFADLARADVALPLACGQTMTSPTTVATMLAALDLKPGQSVLEVGTGSGYVTALLAKLGGVVHSRERRAILCEGAAARLAASGLAGAVDLACRDGLACEPEGERYDRILLNGVVAGVPSTLTDRLQPGGRIVAAIAAAGSAPRLLVITRDPGGALAHVIGAPVRLSPLVFAESLAPKSTTRNRSLT